MAEDTKEKYAKLPTDSWLALRRQFKKSVPQQPLTHSYIKGVLGNMTDGSVRSNVLAPLKTVGLLDSTNKPTELAVRWRDDTQYANVCQEIQEKAYPQEVRDLFPDADADPAAVRDWFANHTGQGENAATKMARFYLLLTRADPNAESGPSKARKVAVTTRDTTAKKPTVRNKKPVTLGTNGTKNGSTEPTGQVTDIGQLAENSSGRGLSLHIDIQIHISPEAPADQIDKIFESMAKHLPLKK